MIESVVITGANAGLGKETARQFALKQETQKVILFLQKSSEGSSSKERA
jgi:NAD(P)-dependent dehydrogenase (short-subunit alcohol dehydrogenase family)